MAGHDFTRLLISKFAAFLGAYDHDCPFKRHGQLEYHVRTIRLLRENGSTDAALDDESFQESVYQTLGAWGIGKRGSVLRPFPEFVSALRAKRDEIRDLSSARIDAPDLNVPQVADRLAKLIVGLDIVGNKSKLVAGSKTLHHILPELVVPIDRVYTQPFFGWSDPRLQNHPERCLTEAFTSFVRIARATNPGQYQKGGWYSSPAKIIDNAIVGLWCFARRELERQKAGEDGTPGRPVSVA